jgi:hypothetical protein
MGAIGPSLPIDAQRAQGALASRGALSRSREQRARSARCEACGQCRGPLPNSVERLEPHGPRGRQPVYGLPRPEALQGRGLEAARGRKGCIIHLVAILDWPRGRRGRRRFLLLVVTGDNAGARNLDFEGALEQPDAL